MREQIADHLRKIEAQHDCKVLYACESGSRAWGFASPDSDFDLRFIYAHTLEWHLRLEARPDTIDLMAPNDLDLSGWELAKMLRLFAGCNLALNEWFDSPEVYFEQPDFSEAIRKLICMYFNPRKALHHYLSMAENTMAQNLSGETIKIKKAFYILRPLLACTWVMKQRTMPPTRFRTLLEQELSGTVLSDIEALLAQKQFAGESEPIILTKGLLQWLHETMECIKGEVAEVEPKANKNWKPLNDLMVEFTKR